MRHAFIGAGALGGFFGAKLITSGAEVTFVVRERTAKALGEHGLHVSGATQIDLPNVNFTTDARQVGPVDVVWLTTKTQQVATAITALEPLVGSATGVITVQNGVGTPQLVANAIGAQHVLPGVVHGFLTQVEPGRISHASALNRLTFAEWDNADTPRLQAIRDELTRANVGVGVVDDIWVALWVKLCFVMPLGVLGAMVDKPISVLRSRLRGAFAQAIAETAGIARGRGVAMPQDVVDATLALADAQPEQATASMHRDLVAGVASELHDQLGVVLDWASQDGTDVSLLRLSYDTLVDKFNLGTTQPPN